MSTAITGRKRETAVVMSVVSMQGSTATAARLLAIHTRLGGDVKSVWRAADATVAAIHAFKLVEIGVGVAVAGDYAVRDKWPDIVLAPEFDAPTPAARMRAVAVQISSYNKRPAAADIPSVTNEQLYWLAGLLEGEGCFAYAASPTIVVGMTDRDVIARVAALFRRNVNGPYQYTVKNKPVYYTRIHGAAAIAWMGILQPLMGRRRQARIAEIVQRWNRAPSKAHRIGTATVARCHPTRIHYAERLCRSCYRKSRYAKGLPR